MHDSTHRPLTVALLGNPNTGKSTLFSALVGIHQRVGNYPGVTVEKKTGQMEHAGQHYTLIDLPGLYGLSPRSRDEMVVVGVLLGWYQDSAPVDAVICIMDASNLQRNLYLLSQVLELGLPTVVALNMMDVAQGQGIRIDVRQLQHHLGVPVVPMQAHRGIGVAEFKEALAQAVQTGPPTLTSPLPEAVHNEVARLAAWGGQPGGTGWPGHRHRHRFGRRRALEGRLPGPPPAWLLQRLLLDVTGQLEALLPPAAVAGIRGALQAARHRLSEAGYKIPGVETAARHQWIARVLGAAVAQPEQYKPTATDLADRLLTHRVWGTLVFAALLLAIFQAVFVLPEPLTGGIEAGTRLLGRWLETTMPPGALRSLLIGGVLAGVGNVLSFLPQIAMLFLFIALLEDCGYMARAAFLMDRLMSRAGLSGKSFIPLLSCFACTIPGIMATRVIEDERDRLTTILVAPLVTCSARLPVFTLLIAAFVPRQHYLGGLLNLQGLTLVGLYGLGIASAVAVAKVLKGSVFKGSTPPFLMELPTYKWPSARTVAIRVVERALSFVRFAGTMILAVSILVWAAMYYPHDAQTVEAPFRARKEMIESQLDALGPSDGRRAELLAQRAALEREIAAAYQRQSLLGRFGRLVEPVFRPLGWDWRIGAAVIASLPAREIVVATLGVIFNFGQQEDFHGLQEAAGPQARLQAATWEKTDRPLFTVPVALSIMVFFALCAQCAGTLAVIRRETGTWRWPIVTFGYMTALAYLGALVTFRLASWLGA